MKNEKVGVLPDALIHYSICVMCYSILFFPISPVILLNNI